MYEQVLAAFRIRLDETVPLVGLNHFTVPVNLSPSTGLIPPSFVFRGLSFQNASFLKIKPPPL